MEESKNLFICVMMESLNFTILDKDECADGSAQCPGECKNTEGGFECLCPKGFVINEDKTQCVGKQ